ncbi:MAG TPA: PASTA domain-containing protein [Solirubrobacterales bacterium]|nr:PASTA domain-containing protein [Solirubrobacterales bacterium]
MKHPLAIATACLVAIALVPATASASNLTVEGGVLVLRAAPGEQNTVDLAGDETDALIEVGDADRPGYPAGTCEPAFWNSDAVNCEPQPGGIRIELGDGDDRTTVGAGVPGGGTIVVLGGEGVDTLGALSHPKPVVFDGGNGNDVLSGGGGNDVLLGGVGDDDLNGRGGGDELRGGEGADKLLGDDYQAPGADIIDGGPGSDRIERDWSSPISQPQPAIDVSLDGLANDGRPGEGDNVTAVESIHLLSPAALSAGADPVDFEVFNASGAPSRLVGGPGADRLRSYDAADTIDGAAGNDWIEAGYGADTITGGPGVDTINADAGSGACNFLVCRLPHGNDTINVRDGEADTVECGPGTDSVSADAADTLSNCETVSVARAGGGKPGGGCVVPQLKRGEKLPAARAKLRGAHCGAKVVRVASKLKRGRLVKVSPRAGTKLKAGAKVELRVSRGKARRPGKASAAEAGASAIEVVSPAPAVVDPVKVRCINVSYGGRVCGKRFKDDWSRGWWADPAEFEIVDVRLSGDTEMTVPFDEYKSFKGEGFSTVKAQDGVNGKFRLPSRNATVPVTSAVARPVAWAMQSVGAWTTEDGSVGCNVIKPGGLPTSFAGVVAADQRKGTISIQWSIVPAGFRCLAEGPVSNPEFEALPSEAMTVKYRAAGFRDAELLKLPISIEWEGVQESDGAHLKLDWFGRVVLRRVHHSL